MDLNKCDICPRKCSVNRIAGEKGACLVSGEKIYVARTALHFWEEPCISGTRGSGTVFFSGCNLHCIFCQNREISRASKGKALSVSELADAFMYLQGLGAHNINLVTPTHYAYQIREALIMAKEEGLSIPVVYNTGGYERRETLAALNGLIDIYLTDFKYMDPTLSAKFSGAADYPEQVKAAVSEMVRQVPGPVYDEAGIMQKGVITRLLLLPGHVKDAKAVVSYIYENYGETVVQSLMSQYTPLYSFEKYPELNRPVTKREYERLVCHALDLGITNAFIQEGGVAKESFIPDFDPELVYFKHQAVDKQKP